MSKITPKNAAQKELCKSIHANQMTIAFGSAGTGKSYIVSGKAAEMLSDKRVQKIVITRPNVPVETSIGFLPGTLEEKMGPWVIPIIANLEAFLGKGAVEMYLKNGRIEVVPFETIRGRSFENSFIILDEAQNTTPKEMSAFVTRIGDYSTVAVTGDSTQTDIEGDNGLDFLIDMVEGSEDLSRYIGLVEFTVDDIVRSGLCGMFVRELERLRD